MRFHHIGYATADIDRYVEEFFRPVFAPLSIGPKVSEPVQRVTVCFAQMQGGAVIELVEPYGNNSPVASVIASARGGVNHLCYEDDDLDRELAACRRKRCLPVSKPVPAAAFEGTPHRVSVDPATRFDRPGRKGLTTLALATGGGGSGRSSAPLPVARPVRCRD